LTNPSDHDIAAERDESHAKLGGWHDYPFVAEAAAEANELARPSGRFLVRRAGDSAASGNARIFGVAFRPGAPTQLPAAGVRRVGDPCRAGAARSGRRALAADATDRPRC
jgi:hypothetical protein